MNNLRRKILIGIIVNLVVLAAAGVFFLHSVRHLPVPDPLLSDIESWRGLDAAYHDGAFYAADSIRDQGVPCYLLWGPYLPLKQGSYTAVIEYTADEDQQCFAGDDASGGETQHYIASRGILNRFQNKISYQFELTEDVKEFQIVFAYNGHGEFGVRSISLSPNNNRAKRIFTGTFAVMALADLLCVFFSLERRKKQTILGLAGITILISLPIFVNGIYKGHDLEIHLLRIEAIAQALRSGQFPARISSLPLYGQGYPFSIYYNDVFLYLPAVLRLLGISVIAAYKFYLLFVNALTAVLGYYSFGRIFRSRKSGLVLSLLYAAASYRFVNVYVRAAVGEYTAAAFLPLAALALYRIYTDEETSIRRCLENSLLFTAALSGILGAHILTMIMLGFLLLLICLTLFKRTFRKKTLLTFLMTGCLTLLVNLYFLVPFIDYYINVPTMIGELVEDGSQMIQKSGVFPAQFLSFFQKMAGNADDVVEGRFQSTPGLPLMLILLYALYLRVIDGLRGKARFYLAFSVLTLVLATDVFPWNGLALRSAIWGLLAQIQFPWRFLGFAALFLTLLGGELIVSEKRIPIGTILAAAGAIMIVWAASNLFNENGTFYIYDTSGINPERTGHEYLLRGTSWEAYYPYLQTEGMEQTEIRSQNSYEMNLYCRSGSSSSDHRVTLPLFNYKGYHVYDAEGKEIAIGTGEHNHISFLLPAGYDGMVRVQFRDPAVWTAALWLSSVVVFCLAGWLLFSLRKKSVDQA